MSLGGKVFSILMTASVLTLWTILGGFDLYKGFLAEQGVELGEIETIFSGYVFVFATSVIVTFLLLWGIKHRRSSED